MTGSIRSSTIRSGRVVWARRRPSCPSVAGCTSKPSLRRLYVSTSTRARSSSMIRIVCLDIRLLFPELRAVADDFPFDKVNHVFGNIGGVVGNPFDVPRRRKQLQRRLDQLGGSFHHL